MLRQARTTAAFKKIDTMKPLNMEELGIKDDPCFGKHHSLKASACKRCGDSELCSIATLQYKTLQRAKKEKKIHYKDTEILVDPKKDSQVAGVKYIKRLVKRGKSLNKVRKLVLKKFPDMNLDKLKRIYDKAKNNLGS